MQFKAKIMQIISNLGFQIHTKKIALHQSFVGTKQDSLEILFSDGPLKRGLRIKQESQNFTWGYFSKLNSVGPILFGIIEWQDRNGTV